MEIACAAVLTVDIVNYKELTLIVPVGQNPVNDIDPWGLAGRSRYNPSGSNKKQPTGERPGGKQPTDKDKEQLMEDIGNIPDSNMGSEWVFDFKRVCAKISCNPDCPSDEGPWIVKDNSKCVCLEWKIEVYERK